jgi:hypothetical protein
LAPEGGLGGGLQSTVWLYVLSHVGFALFAIVYTLLKDADPMEWLSPRSIHARVLTTVGSVTALVCCATVFVTAGHTLLPRIMLDTAQVSYLRAACTVADVNKLAGPRRRCFAVARHEIHQDTHALSSPDVKSVIYVHALPGRLVERL